MRIIITLILVALVAIGLVAYFGMNAPVTDSTDTRPISEQSNTDTQNTEPALKTYRDNLTADTAFTLQYPSEATVAEVEDGTTYNIKYVGPQNKPNTELTDGYVLTMRFVPAASAQAYASERASDGAATKTTFGNRTAYRFTTESELGGQRITHHVFPVTDDSGLVADISYVIYLSNGTESYDDEVQSMIESLTFTSAQSETTDMIKIESPTVGATINNPVTVTGQARGYWFFEATAPVVVVNWDGLIIGEGYIEATESWMTEDFVPFTGTISYDLPADSYSNRGTVIFRRANASGLPENDAAVEVTVELE